MQDLEAGVTAAFPVVGKAKTAVGITPAIPALVVMNPVEAVELPANPAALPDKHVVRVAIAKVVWVVLL
jgi:hypothetical protein